jgi:putative ABC transport system permease protein
MEHRVKADGIWTSPTTSGPTADALLQDIPEVEAAVTTTWPQPYLISVGDKSLSIRGRYAGTEFFNMFSYPLIQGNADNILLDKNSVVISDELAKKLFHTTENVIGKTIEFQHKFTLQVSGVFKSVPGNASEKFEFVIPFERFKEGRDFVQSWGSTSFLTLVLLKPDVDMEKVNLKIADFIKVKTEGKTTHRTLFLKKFSDQYLYGKYENGVFVGGRITYVKLFSLIAVFILLIACINFMNLSTAKASRRIKEVGIKKAVGAGRKALVFQYLGESMLMSFLSLLVAILFVDLFLSQFNIITGKQLVLQFNLNMILILLTIILLTGLIAGSYPALYLSGFKPATVLKGKLNSSLGELWARKGLVIIQFSLSILFIVSVVVVYKQMEFIQSANLGYNKNGLIYFSLSGSLSDMKNQESLIAEVKNVPGVEMVSSTSHNLAGHNGGTSGVQWEGKDPDDKTEFEYFFGNYELIETMGMEIKEGRTFSRDFPSDSSGIIFNENAIRFMGLKDPIGKSITLFGSNEMHIIGVVKDFNYESLHENIKPVFFINLPSETYLLIARLTNGREKKALSGIQELYHKYNPDFPFEYQFVDENHRLLYLNEQRVSTLSKYFAGMAILISCLGLFGLAAFTAERRLKEIGIRKVLGSSVFGIVYLLSSDFTKIVLLSILIAIPISYLAANYWLANFAFRIQLEWWYFFGAGLMALLIAWLTVGSQALKAARVNPTQCLKNE